MIESMVDYVLERGNQHYGQFAPRGEQDQKAALFNNRKLLQYLFQDNETSSFSRQNQKRISDMKYQQISGQLNYFSQKLHGQLNKKHLAIDSQLYKLQNEWLRKKMPDFYCYYFLKFSYANTYSRMHQLFVSELQHMSRQKDTYLVIKKTVEARQICLANLRRQIASVSDLDIQQSLQTMKQQRRIKKKKNIQNQQKGYKKKNKKDSDQQVGKSWKNKLELVFQNISHLRKLTCYVVQLIKNWKNSIYGISQDPRRFRQRVIFFHNDANYLLKMNFDNKFIFESFLKKLLTFGHHYDPFLLKPCMILENKKTKMTQDQQILLSLLKPTQIQMDKMTKALVLLAQQEYDQDQQSRFLNQRKNYGQLEQRKKYIEKRRDIFASKSQANLKGKEQIQKPKSAAKQQQLFSKNKKSQNTKRQIQQVKMQKDEQMTKSKIQTTLNRVKKIRSVDLKKISPYLSRNQRIAKAQKVIQLEHKFRVAQNQYVQTVKKQKQQTTRRQQMKKQWDSSQKEIINNKIFNKYIEQNLKLMEQANKKAFLYKNKVSPKKSASVVQDINYNRISFKQRKQAEYERNLQSYQRDDRVFSQSAKVMQNQANMSQKNFRSKGTKAIIQISNKGIRSNQNIVDYQLTGKKGKNVGKILQNSQKADEIKMIQMKLNPNAKQQYKKKQKQSQEKSQQMTKQQARNLFQTQQKPQIIIMRQQPQKIQQIKQFLYAKIKQQLLQQMKKSSQQKQVQLNNMIQEQKRRKIQQIMEQRRLQQQRRKQQLQRMRLQQLQRQRKKIDFNIKVQPIQYSQDNVGAYFDKLFQISPQTYHRMFLNQKIQEKKDHLMDQFYLMFLRGFLDDEEVAYSIVRYDWKCEASRKLVFQYIVVKNFYHFISSFHQFSQYLWKNDPVDHIQIVVFKNAQNQEGKKFIQDLQQYADRRGQTFQRQLYSNITQIKYVWARPKQYQNIEFPFKNHYFGKLFNLKSQLLSAAISMNQRFTPKIDMNLQVFTNYVFLLQQLFRRYLTPEQVVQLRQHSTNIRRLKDIFRIVLELQKSNPVVNQLTVIQGLNLDDLYQKMKQKMKPPYDKYYWHHFYDKTLSNRLLLSILEFKLDLQFPINSCHLDDRRFLRINPRRKVLVLKSSVYSRQPIYVLNTNNPKIRMFLIDAENYKLMRIELFVFLNLVFNNIVQDSQKFVNSFWFPQFLVNTQHGKQVKRITDFSISMKKSFFLSQQIYYANHQYIKNAISFLPKKSDVIYKQAVIVGFLHTDVEAGSTGMPLYGKLIDRNQMFKYDK